LPKTEKRKYPVKIILKIYISSTQKFPNFRVKRTGCLKVVFSVRWLYGLTFRSKKATITAYDENGKKFTRGASGLLAQIFQHETDHLNGILFIDHAKNIKEELPQKVAYRL